MDYKHTIKIAYFTYITITMHYYTSTLQAVTYDIVVMVMYECSPPSLAHVLFATAMHPYIILAWLK